MWGATKYKRTSRATDKFQSTHPCGVRRDQEKNKGGKKYFNPRTHVGCDI